MGIWSITSYKTGAALFTGDYESFNACLAAAAAQNLDLPHADLRHRNLSNLTLDGARLPGADFSYSNLTGANLSEAVLAGACFAHSDLYNACLACADLRACNFEAANFGATDIAHSDLSGALFSSLSCFSLDFALAKTMQDCQFRNTHGITCRMSQPPIVIRGLNPAPLVMLDDVVTLGHTILRRPRLQAQSREITITTRQAS